ncbi:hypothetical protein A2303_07205 [Candidatus Falkowbacteria bacterium RIFOXYB2_FULL_47_14]|uniref:PABS domain-containing protein n=1 Tax=Candidatus Falkowbacteria bacterium RIFOXYA2_FULL_47_19 TaxID=1797994 RepID=A0A1F5SH32_9BACT|nr:MAG: hypothetical protein A2227_00950 [Candidatus Falkowbacteria bacterium RIFOXYA2_FULL_47_19]OGF34935.1 MAG: hypothetical protein A2468_06910 [Candidatus Falkowbacteria bacterium RIFOXYC2_FULL_46_15]OGF43650.1 MAG: hypothetical protein A2303_07205 [Candidatus Falkowbacteria bacterium RIFOXYB2_FULL_47_14]
MKIVLEVILFITGAAGMIFEIAGARVLAPYLGTSLVVWTSLIGIILGSLSFGYLIGGKLADRRQDIKVLAAVLGAAAFFVGLTASGKDIFLVLLDSLALTVNSGSILAAIVLFAPGSAFLGMATPYAVRLKLRSLDKSGGVVGRLYAISTIGSIAGTFAAGFWLIPYFGTTMVLWVLALILALTALIISGRRFWIEKISILAVASIIFYSGSLAVTAYPGMADVDTAYNRYWIYERDYEGRSIRVIKTDPFGTQAAVYTDNPDEIVFDYLKFFHVAEHFHPRADRALLVGGGIFTFPRDYILRNPDSEMDVVELDGRLIDLAREHFYYRDDPRIGVFHEDGRIFLNRNKTVYDHIYLDAFNSHISIPFQLTTREAVQKIHDSLSDDGVVVLNLISAFRGDKGKFLRAELATYKEIFPQVFLFAVHKGSDPAERQNLILIATKKTEKILFYSDDQEINDSLENIWTEELDSDLPVLTDDYAPVDFYTKEMMFK